MEHCRYVKQANGAFVKGCTNIKRRAFVTHDESKGHKIAVEELRLSELHWVQRTRKKQSYKKCTKSYLTHNIADHVLIFYGQLNFEKVTNK